jgi:hypothetical protein
MRMKKCWKSERYFILWREIEHRFGRRFSKLAILLREVEVKTREWLEAVTWDMANGILIS